jgi:hypothetical protein
MKHLSPRALAGISILALVFGVFGSVLAPPALAQLKKPPSITGAWQFATGKLGKRDCTISGEIEFRKGASASEYACTFTSQQVCGRPEDKNIIEVNQSCTARYANGEFAIVSKVEKIVSTPGGLAGYSYEPDNFFVRPQSASEMKGHFESINMSAVRFWRTGDLTS